MFSKLTRLLKAGEGKSLKRYDELIRSVNSLEDNISSLSDSQLSAKTAEFKKRFKDGQGPEDLMPEAFAVVRETARRIINMRHFDVQIMGGAVLFEGKIAEMKTGEGKTLAATLPVYLNSIMGKSTHMVTVNDYLAKRDSEWMGPVYGFLGLKVGLLQNGMDKADKKQQYLCDVIHGTNNEFGFDYLRDNMVLRKDDMVQQGHPFAIIDEVDSILIDEARTPLIISGVASGTTELYQKFARLVPRLEQDIDFDIDEKARTVAITEEGVEKVEKMTGLDNLYSPQNFRIIHALNQSLKARYLFKKDVDYMLKDGQIVIVDEFTGRLMPGRRYSEGLHQAIEAREGVRIRDENQTLATITIQNYFRMYEKLAGMTGTAITEAGEFRHIYKLETVVIPTNMPMIRQDLPDLIYKDENIKFDMAVEDIASRYEKGQPVLVGTISIEKSELLSGLLKKRGIAHQVLNARYHEKEAEIIALAGQKNAVTIATNMAGRGTDIVLGQGVTGLGGLHVLGTERHESRRIDNQLRGRSGRQGDIGSSQFYLSTEDDLLRLFGSDRIHGVMQTFNFPDDVPIQHPIITRSIENAQRQVEGRNFEIRKHVLQYDDVMNKQREVIYTRRKNILEQEDLREAAIKMLEDVIDASVDFHINESQYPEKWDLEGLENLLGAIFKKESLSGTLDRDRMIQDRWDRKTLKQELTARARELYREREEEHPPGTIRRLEKMVMLNVIDNMWQSHLLEMDYLKEGIGLRAIAQKDPLVEYKHEAFTLFKQLIDEIKFDTIKLLFNARIVAVRSELKDQEQQLSNVSTSGPSAPEEKIRQPVRADINKVGRNDPCPCGSGKKYKKCCGQ
jgi:preprotein translocase subunit SecA